MDQTPLQIWFNTYGRSLAVKLATRAILYGGASAATYLGVASPDTDSETKAGAYFGAILFALAAMGLDYLQHRCDKRDQARVVAAAARQIAACKAAGGVQ